MPPLKKASEAAETSQSVIRIGAVNRTGGDGEMSHEVA